MSCEDWLKGRRARRETGNKVAPEIIRRLSSSSDRRLRKLYNGDHNVMCSCAGMEAYTAA